MALLDLNNSVPESVVDTGEIRSPARVLQVHNGTFSETLETLENLDHDSTSGITNEVLDDDATRDLYKSIVDVPNNPDPVRVSHNHPAPKQHPRRSLVARYNQLQRSLLVERRPVTHTGRSNTRTVFIHILYIGSCNHYVFF